MSEWGDEVIRYKYDPLPEDAPRHRKKSKKRHMRSDHKHEYERVCIDAHSELFAYGERFPTYHLGIRCKVCGRLRNIRLWHFKEHVPDDMPLYEVDDFYGLIMMKELPEELRVR